MKKLENRGVDISYKQKMSDHWSYDIGYSREHVEYIANENMIIQFMGWNSMPGQPKGYRARLHYKNRNWRANLLGIMASGRNDYYYPSQNEYVVLDFNASYDITNRATVYFIALNFTDELYSNEETGRFRNMYVVAPSRFFQIGATYKF